MGVMIRGEYLGDTRVKLIHESGSEIVTCAPKDNGGDGSRFSPTDLAVSSLGSCILTIMAMAAEKNGTSFKGASFEAEKVMQKAPRMIKEIILDLKMPGGISLQEKKMLVRAAKACPVKRSLGKDVKITLRFN